MYNVSLIFIKDSLAKQGVSNIDKFEFGLEFQQMKSPRGCVDTSLSIASRICSVVVCATVEYILPLHILAVIIYL